MEDLTPPLLHAIREVRWHLSSGKGMREAFPRYLDDAQDALARELRGKWVMKLQGGAQVPLRSHFAQSFWDLIERGLAGQPAFEALGILECEVEKAAERELDAHLASLPFKVLIPLLIFQFPAYLMLLLGPILRELSAKMGG